MNAINSKLSAKFLNKEVLVNKFNYWRNKNSKLNLKFYEIWEEVKNNKDSIKEAYN